MKKNIVLIVLFLFALVSTAATVPEVKPLTNNILMIRFDDGYAVHHKRGQPRSEEYMVVDPLDVVKAMSLPSYTIKSSDDPNYAAGLNPLQIGRKSKPTEFALMCQSYNGGCVNEDPDHALEHWIYLFLPNELKEGKSYTITLDGLASTNSFSFTYNERMLHSEAIHVNNIGYSTAAPAKYGYVYHWLGDKGSLNVPGLDGRQFRLLNTTTNEFVFSGSVRFRKSKTNAETGQASETPSANFSAADIYECDFSAFNSAGTYKLVVDGVGSSFPFVIAEDAYQDAFYWTMKGLYQNRSGIKLEAPYTEFPRPAPHHPTLTPGFSGKLKYSAFRTFDLSSYDGAEADKSKVESGYKGVLESTFGWYQDAGDWDGYYTHTHVPAYLLFLYEAGPAKFTDGELDIPESGNGIPDLLDEAAWLIRYFKRAKDEIKQKGWGTGGVPGARVFGDLWGSDAPGDVGQASWQDVQRNWYLLGEDPWMSYKYAALAAQFAFILEQGELADPQGVNWRQEAIDAFSWAKANSKPGDESLKQGSYLLKHQRLYAAAALYRLTGASEYHSIVLDEIDQIIGTVDPGNQDQMFGVWMYLLSGNQWRETSVYNKVKILVTGGSDKYLVNAANVRGARWGGDFYFPMLVGQGSTPMVTPGVYGYLLNKNTSLGTSYLSYLHTTADYYLGCNPLNMTWISGVGERHPVGLFHLDWWYSDKADPNNSFPVMKGIVPYGPWRYENLGDLGWWNPNWAYSDKAGNPRIYPTNVNQWPGHERWFDMRVSPLSSEFTIHQNTIIAAFVYGFLTAGATADLQEGTITSTEEERASQVLLFPNPTSDTITIRTSSGMIKQIEVLDSDGRKTKRLKNIEKSSYSLAVNNWIPGIYFIKVYLRDGKMIQHRFVVGQ